LYRNYVEDSERQLRQVLYSRTTQKDAGTRMKVQSSAEDNRVRVVALL